MHKRMKIRDLVLLSPCKTFILQSVQLNWHLVVDTFLHLNEFFFLGYIPMHTEDVCSVILNVYYFDTAFISEKFLNLFLTLVI